MIDAERVREAADDVLDGVAYAELRPGLVERAVAEFRSWIAELLFDAFTGQAAASAGIALAVGVVAAVVVLGVIGLLGVQRRRAADLVVDEDRGRTWEEARASADAAAAAGDHVRAVRDGYAALVLLLHDRDVLPRVPGTTVGEVDGAVARAAPVCAEAVMAAGRVLADVVYGHRPAGPDDDAVVAAAVDAAARAIPRRAVAA